MSDTFDADESGGSGIHLSDDSREILAALVDRGGDATTSELKQETGLETNKIRYRISESADALAGEYGLVQSSQLTRAEWGGKGIPPKMVELTRKGREAVKSGVVGDVLGEGGASDEVSISRGQFEEFNERLGRLEGRVNSLVHEQREGGVESSESGGVDEEGLESLRGDVESIRSELESLRGEWEVLVREHGWLYSEVRSNYGPLINAMFRAFQSEDVDVREFVDESELDEEESELSVFGDGSLDDSSGLSGGVSDEYND